MKSTDIYSISEGFKEREVPKIKNSCVRNDLEQVNGTIDWLNRSLVKCNAPQSMLKTLEELRKEVDEPETECSKAIEGPNQDPVSIAAILGFICGECNPDKERI